MIIFFAFFYTGIVFNPDEQAENLRKYGGFIPGIRPGERTATYIEYVLIRLTTVGSIYLALVALLPEYLLSKTSIPFYLGRNKFVNCCCCNDGFYYIKFSLICLLISMKDF